MNKRTPKGGTQKHGRSQFVHDLRQNWQFLVFLTIPVIYLLIFEYGPLLGMQIAFRDYKPKMGMFGSPWAGFKHFKDFLTSYNFLTILKNTLAISAYSIFAGFPIPVILALLINSTKHRRLAKLTQNISYIPHFISVVVMVGILNQVFNPISGLLGTVWNLFSDGNGYLKDIRTSPKAFSHLYVWSGIWQNMGWSTIIYISALSGVSQDQHEAAIIDGASRFKRILHVDLPAILPTVAIMLILRCGQVMSIGYEKVYIMQNDMNLSKSEVISTYVYKVGLGKNQLSYASAIDLFNSVINCVLLLTVNAIAREASDGEMGLF